MTNEDIRQELQRWADNQTCKYCNHKGLRIEWRIEAKPIGTFSLAGSQPKVSANEHPYAICPGCSHESRGEWDSDEQ